MTNDDGTLTPHNPDNPNDQLPEYFAPAGNLYMSIGDYAKFVQMNLRGLRGQKTLIRPETMKKLHTPVAGGSFALGWGIQAGDNGNVSFYVGSLDTFLADVQIFPTKNRAVAVVTNVGTSSVDQADGLIQLLSKR